MNGKRNFRLLEVCDSQPDTTVDAWLPPHCLSCCMKLNHHAVRAATSLTLSLPEEIKNKPSGRWMSLRSSERSSRQLETIHLLRCWMLINLISVDFSSPFLIILTLTQSCLSCSTTTRHDSTELWAHKVSWVQNGGSKLAIQFHSLPFSAKA